MSALACSRCRLEELDLSGHLRGGRVPRETCQTQDDASNRPSLAVQKDDSSARHSTGITNEKVGIASHKHPMLRIGKRQLVVVACVRKPGLNRRRDVDVSAAQTVRDNRIDVLVEIEANEHGVASFGFDGRTRLKLRPSLRNKILIVPDLLIDQVAMIVVEGQGRVYVRQRELWERGDDFIGGSPLLRPKHDVLDANSVTSDAGLTTTYVWRGLDMLSFECGFHKRIIHRFSKRIPAVVFPNVLRQRLAGRKRYRTLRSAFPWLASTC